MKKNAYRLHSWLAIFAFIPLLLISVSGSILVFKLEIDRLLMPTAIMVNHDSEPRLEYDTLLASVDAAFPEYFVGTWEIFDDGVRADAVYLIKANTFDWHKVYLNQYTGEMLSQPVGLTDDITDWLVEFHYTFLLHSWGMVIGAVFALVMLLLAITGLIMHRKVYALILRMRWGKAKAALYSDVHKLVGVISSPVLLLLAITGLYWNIAAYLHEVAEHEHHESHVLSSPTISAELSVDALVASAEQAVDGLEVTYIAFAFEPEANIAIYGKVPTAQPFDSNYASGAMFKPNTGALVTTWDGRTAGFVTQLVDSFRHIHFGVFGGRVTQIIWAIVGMMPLILAFTGVYLWTKRRKRKR